jgi:hypothetical protein
MLRRPADPGELNHQPVVRHFPQPGGLGPVGGAPTEIPGGLDLEVTPLAFGVGVTGPRFQQQHIQAAAGQFLGYDRPTAAGPDDDHVAHQPLTSVRPW